MLASTRRSTVIPGQQVSDRARSRWGKIVGVAVAGAAAAALVAGCTSDSSPSAGGDASFAAASVGAEPERNAGAAPATGQDPAAAGPETDSAASDSTDSAPGAGQSIAPIDTSKVIKTADMSVTITVDRVPETGNTAADRDANVAARAAAINQATISTRGIVNAAGGFQSSADGGGSAMLIGLRVPADQYDTVMDKLAGLGEVTNRTESSRDVTAEVVDVNSRVESMTASVVRVRGLLAQATDIADVISIESELAVREADLESLQQQQAALNGQVALSTITLSVTAVTDSGADVEPVVENNEFVAGLNAGWAALLDVLSWVGGAVGALLPFLPLLAVVGVLIWWLIRRARRRTRRGPGEPMPTAPSGSSPTPPAASSPTPPPASSQTPPPASSPTPPPAQERTDQLTPAS